MKLIESLRKWLSPTARTNPHQRAKGLTSTAAFLRGDDDERAHAFPLINAYQQSSWVYAAVSAKAGKVAQTPFKLVTRPRGGGEHALGGGPLADLFERPHPSLDAFSFWELVATWLDLRGEAFVVPLDAQGAVTALRPHARIRALLPLNPDHVSEAIENHSLAGWRYAGLGNASPYGPLALLPEEVIHLRLPNPFHFWRGMSPLSVALLAAQADYAAAQFMKGLILNNADTGLIFTTDKSLSDAQNDQIVAQIEQRKRRAGMADRPLVLGGVRVEKPVLSTADLQFLENRKFNRQEILAILRVPDTVLGFTEDANRAVAEAQMLQWIHNVIAPLCRRLESALQPLVRALAGREPVTGYFDLDELPELQTARMRRTEAATALFHLGVPLNDVNRALDLGLPQYPWGNGAFLPANLQAVGAAKADPPAKPRPDVPRASTT